MVIDWVARSISDWEDIAFVEKVEEEGQHGKTTHKSLDSSIMEMTNDIAYGIHDLEDSVSLKFVDQRLFEGEIKKGLMEPLLFENFGEQNDKSYEN
ncbi:MAG: hypothetical protein OXI37_10235 [Gammaproteobacteria bacterium]|nr:hypothetical protein [Gammaproteobacteria bacterium]